MPVFHHHYHTETQGTAITEVIPPVAGMIPRVENMAYRTAGTSHTLTVMRPVADTTFAAAAGGGATTLELTNARTMLDSSGDAEPLANNDWIVFAADGGNNKTVYEAAMVTGLSTNDITVAATTNAVKAGGKVWIMGEAARSVHHIHTSNVSVEEDWTGMYMQAGIPHQIDVYNGGRDGRGDPLLFHSNNITATGFLMFISGRYITDASNYTTT